MNSSAISAASQTRLQQIEQARRAVMHEGLSLTDGLVQAWFERTWIERSWRRCLQQGQRPEDRVGFDLVPPQAARRADEANHELLAAARPVLQQLTRAIANTRYFAILTDANGVVIDTQGAADHPDPRARVIARVGVDLSERSVGTTAIGAALAELQPVWLHRGEHFFHDTSCFSCAGAPLFGPDGRCIGMLDLTGIEAVERPELKHLAAQSARSIENALVTGRPHRLLVRLNWPGRPLGGDTDGLVTLDGDGWVTASNQAARQMLSQLAQPGAPVHSSELFAASWESLFDAARLGVPTELPSWSGLRLAALPVAPGDVPRSMPTGSDAAGNRVPLRELEASLIRKAVDEARGNVLQAALSLGISRATVYRKLGRKPSR